MPHCSVPGCHNNRTKKISGLSFHKLPKDTKRQKEWLQKIRRDPGLNFNVAYALVCSDHFKQEDFVVKGHTTKRTLISDAVPTVFEWSKCTKKRKDPVIRSPCVTKRRRLVPPKNQALESEDTSVPSQDASPMVESDETTDMDESKLLTPPPTAAPSSDHDYEVLPHSSNDKLLAAHARIKQLEALVSLLKKERCFYTRLSRDPSLVEFYTGFPDYDLLMSFYQAIEPTAATMTRYNQYLRFQRGKSKFIRVCFAPQNLPLINQFLLVLRKLRLGLFDKDMADQSDVSESTVSRIILSWVNYLYFILGSAPLWPSRAQVQDHMPETFEEYPNTRVILDCTEIWVQCPSSLLLNTEFYSHYKSRTTLKGLVGICPAGAVTFVSKLYPGSISDKAITRVSGIIDLIEPGDEIMVDKGFTIKDLLDDVGANLVIPPFLTGGRGQFEKEEVTQTQSIARLRVHVERAIRRVKCYHIFDRVIPLTLAGSVNQMWSVCCLLTNFLPRLF